MQIQEGIALMFAALIISAIAWVTDGFNLRISNPMQPQDPATAPIRDADDCEDVGFAERDCLSRDF